MKAVALLNAYANARLGPALVEACRQSGMELELDVADAGYVGRLGGVSNLVTWGVKLPARWYERRGTNALYLENGLLCQREGVWIDARGWFADSGLCRERHFDAPPRVEDLDRLARIVRDAFRWPLLTGGDPAGPVLFAAQREADAPCRHHFPARFEGDGILASALRHLAKHLPQRRVWIRPHPRFREEWERNRSRIAPLLQPAWSVEASPDVYATLARCSALVTINSTLATEALCLGLPVATLGEGAFTGSGATLECARDPRRLQSLGSWQPDRDAVIRYLGAVLRHQLSYRATPAEVLAHPEFRRWLARAR